MTDQPARKLLDQMSDAELATLYDRADRAEAERDAARAALAALHEGEEPDTDPLAEPTPAQWLWRWNRATPEQRLEVAATFMANAAQAERCMFMNHEARLAEHNAKRGQ